MRIILALIILFINASVFCQRNKLSVDSLAKYSYPIIGVSSSITAGTGFFIKYKSHLYFVTAKHIVSGCDENGRKSEKYPDLFLVGNDNISSCFTIDMKLVQKMLSCKGLDIYVCRIDSKYVQYYNSVDSFIKPQIEDFGTVEIFGYPISSYDTGYLELPKRKSHLSIPEQTFDFSLVYDSTGKLDNSFRKITYPKSVEVVDGFSGSLVFLQNKRTKEWRIIGLVSATLPIVGDSRASMLFVDIENILDNI